MRKTFGFLAIICVVPVAAAAAESPVQPSPGTVRVVAQATIRVKPDQAQFDVGVTTDQKSALAAIAENGPKMERVLAALKKEVRANSEIKTSQLTVSPRFEETENSRLTARVIGYVATNTVRVKVTDVGSVAKLLDVAFQSGANVVDRVGISLKDPEAAENQALGAASAKARARATAMAESQGLRVGDVVWVSEGDRYDPHDPIEGGGGRYRYTSRASLRTMPLEFGSVEVSATVTVVFALKAR
jgi:uncharacterized protein YggE